MLQELSKLEVRVGFQAGEAQEEDGTDICEVAAYNELGTEHIPARPFLRKSVDENVNKINSFMKAKVRDLTQGVSTIGMMAFLLSVRNSRPYTVRAYSASTWRFDCSSEFNDIPDEDVTDPDTGKVVTHGVKTYLELYSDQISEKRFGKTYQKALAYLTAHKLKMNGPSSSSLSLSTVARRAFLSSSASAAAFSAAAFSAAAFSAAACSGSFACFPGLPTEDRRYRYVLSAFRIDRGRCLREEDHRE